MPGSKFIERIGKRVRTVAVDKVPSGSPVQLSLRFNPEANTPKAAVIMARRHLSLRKAHAALTAMIESGEASVTVPCVEDLETLKSELASVGIVASSPGR